ncbi:hypothetical protein [Burkholderia ubonensis]|nr:hypothetical protein [Burkholderia ubonensis]
MPIPAWVCAESARFEGNSGSDQWPIHLDALAYDGRFADFLVSID